MKHQEQTFVDKVKYHFLAPENLPGNFSILLSTVVFGGSIYAFHAWGKYLAI